MNDYLDKGNLQFSEQLNLCANKLSAYMGRLGIDQTTVNAVKADATYFSFMITSVSAARDYFKSWAKQKKGIRGGYGNVPFVGFPIPVDVSTPPASVLPGVEKRFRNLVKQIKSNPNYTLAIGKDLGITGVKPSAELTAPVLKLTMKGGKPTITCKRGNSHGIRIYSKRTGEADFTFLDVSTRGPFVDERSNLQANVVETRQYYAYYILKDVQVGAHSNIVSISLEI